jgi:hypothetical protein
VFGNGIRSHQIKGPISIDEPRVDGVTKPEGRR